MTDWLLPQHLHDIIAPQSHSIEQRRRSLLDLYMSWGYQLIIPPLEEFQESLAQGGIDLDRKMLKVVDNLSGKMMGLRPDITPQSARIDSHILEAQGVNRLCYADKVLLAYPSGAFTSREPIVIGAEIYGLPDWQGDVESIFLLDVSLNICGVKNINIELNHMGIIRELANYVSAQINKPINNEQWLSALQTKSHNQLLKLIAGVDKKTESAILGLLDLYGDSEVLTIAKTTLPKNEKITTYLQELENIVLALRQTNPQINLTIDLSDGRGYNYHSGLMYSAFAPKWSNTLAKGGRYDGYGDRYGHKCVNRPATGFTLDLSETNNCFSAQETDNKNYNSLFTRRVYAPLNIWLDKNGHQFIENLRQQKIAVIVGDKDAGTNNTVTAINNKCPEILVQNKSGFDIIKIK